MKERMRTYVVYFKYHTPGDKNPGPVRHYKLQASNPGEAERMVRQYANYPGLEVLRIEEV